tara:strand:+ start:1579 stop:1848 length:270 start_codon:yes stop_codon:yes gene_type:complete
MDVKGTVTISLDDYHSFLDIHTKNLKKFEHLQDTTRELAVFLSYISSRSDIKQYIESFNIQSKTCKIMYEGDRAVIELRKNKDEINITT